jgi:hypothetical protein
MVKQRVSEEVSSSSIVAPYGFHRGGESEVNMYLGAVANLPDPRTDFAIEAICKMTPESETFKWLGGASRASSKKGIKAAATQSAQEATSYLRNEDIPLFAEAMSRLVTAYYNLREGIYSALVGKEELSWSKIKDYTTDISAVIGFLAGRYGTWKSWDWEQKLVYMVVGDGSVLMAPTSKGGPIKSGEPMLPSRIYLTIGGENVASWKRTYGALKPFVTTAMKARMMLLGLILKILAIDESSLLYYDLFRSSSRWKELAVEGSEIGSYGKVITSRMLRAFSEAKEGCLPVLGAKGRAALADYMALIMVLSQAMVDIDYTVHLEGLKEGIPLTWENYAVQVGYSLILNEDIFEIAYQREIETTWSMFGPRWEQGDRPAPIAFPWLKGLKAGDGCTINSVACVSIPYDEGIAATAPVVFELDGVNVVPETYDLTENTHYPWVGCELSKAGWLVPSEPDTYDKPTISYLSNSDVPVSVGISRKPFSNSVFDVSIDVATGQNMIASLNSLYSSIGTNGNVMGVGRIFRDKGVVFRWIGDLPTYGSVGVMYEGLPAFVDTLRASYKEYTKKE